MQESVLGKQYAIHCDCQEYPKGGSTLEAYAQGCIAGGVLEQANGEQQCRASIMSI